MTKDLREQLDDSALLSHLLTVSSQMARIRSIDPLLHYIVDEVLQLVGAESGYIVLLTSEDGEDGVRDIRVRRNMHKSSHEADDEPEIDAISHSILDKVLTNHKPLIVQNAMMDPNFFDAQSVVDMQLRSVMCAPLLTHDKLLGSIYVENRRHSSRFVKEDLQPLEFFCNQAAVAIENAYINDHLEELVENRTQALAEAKEVAEDANRAKSFFLSSITHELRTPMNGVLGMVTLLNDTMLSPTQRDMVNTIRSSGDILLTIINDILDFSKIEANKLELDKTPFSVKTCIEETFSLFRANARAKNLSLTYSVDQSVPAQLTQDMMRVRQILTNLVGNAIKFTDTGGIDVKVFASLDAESPEEDALYRVYFTVTDTGIGIPKDRMDHLFQSFSQVDATITRRYGGTGLGLAISKLLCEMMGGEIWVESIVGVGSIFHFTILAQRAEKQRSSCIQKASSFDTETAKQKPLKILLAEDNIINQKVALGVLKKCGYCADLAANGIEAIDALKRKPYDVILMDVHMPEMDGLMAARQIRQQWSQAEQPRIIALTADAMEQQRETCLGAGMDDFVTKPIRVSELMDALLRV
ncbi:MAG: ATP-binding protein [Chloroflexota bacterium]